MGVSRTQRNFTTARYFHVINRALDSHDLFVVEQDFFLFERYLGAHLVSSGARLHAYALMSNHFHLVIEPGDCADLSQAIGQMQSRYTKAFNRRNLRRGSLFDRRFLDFEIDGGPEFHRVTRYVHANPIAITGRRGLAAYRWSSLPTYLGHRRVPPWLTTDVLGAEIEQNTYLSSVLDDEPGRGPAATFWTSNESIPLETIVEGVGRRLSQRDHPVDRELRRLVSFFALELRAVDAPIVAAHFSCSPSTVRRDASRIRDRRRADENFASTTDRWATEFVAVAQRQTMW